MTQDRQSSFEHSFYSPSDTTYIHPTAIIGPQVTLEDGVRIGPYCVVIGNTHIGAYTRLSAHVTVGFHAQHTQSPNSVGTITIGKRCDIREFVQIHAPMSQDGSTTIGDDCYLMNLAHVAHDVTIEHDVILTNQVLIAGHAHIEHHALLMGNAGIHQHCRVGQYSTLTPYSGIRQDIPPFSMFTGQPARYSGLNLIGLRRANIPKEHIKALKTVSELFYQEKLLLPEIVRRAECEPWGNVKEVHAFIDFVAASKRGVSKRSLDYGNTTFYT